MSGPGPNPYVGPRAFVTGERLYGRERERSALLDLLVAERVVLLHAPSGAGKSSLLFAGLIPDLRAEGFVVRPAIRVGTEPPATAPTGVNRYLLSALLSLEEGVSAGQQRPLAALAGLDLAAYLGAEPAAAEVLIFDQFEEVLTTDPIDLAAKHAFFAALGAALRPTQRWAVLAIREDHLAGLAPYQRALPTRLRTTFHLGFLDAEAALAAVQLPARELGVDFTDAAARKLIDDLRQVRVTSAAGVMTRIAGPHVEPVQLQVACRDLWERRAPGDLRIDEQDLHEIGDVDEALTRYYDDRVAAVVRDAGVPEALLRGWFDRALITEQGLRGQVLQGATHSAGLDNALTRRLVDTHLVRAEQRRGMIWYELAHDRLIEPVRASNARWSAAHLSPVERQAELWDSRGRPESLLLADLAEIDRLLARSDIAPPGRAFLEHSRTLRRREADTRRLRRIVRILGVVTVLGVMVTLATMVALFRYRSVAVAQKAEQMEAQRDAADRAAAATRALGRQGLSRELAIGVLLMPPERADMAALYAIMASQLTPGWNGRGCLRNLQAQAPQLNALVPGKVAPIQLAHDPVRGVMAALDRDGALHLWELQTRRTIACTRVELGHAAVIFDASRNQFITADRAGSLTFFDPSTGAGRTLALADGPLRAVAVTADGAALATAGQDGTLTLRDARTGAQIDRLTRPDLREDREVSALALAPAGDALAIATRNGELHLWRRGAKVERVSLGSAPGAPTGPLGGLRFTADALIGLHADGRVLRWADAARPGPLAPATVLAELGLDPSQRAEFLALGLAADGEQAAGLLCLDACTRTALVHWDAAEERVAAVPIEMDERDPERRFDLVVAPEVVLVAGVKVAARLFESRAWRPLLDSPHEVSALAVSGDGRRIAAGGCATPDCADNLVGAWSAAHRSPVPLDLDRLREAPLGLAFFAGDERLAAVGGAGQVIFWDMSSGTAVEGPALPAGLTALALRARGPAGLLVAHPFADAVKVWDAVAGRYLPADLRGPSAPVRALAIDPQATRVAAGGCLRAHAPSPAPAGDPYKRVRSDCARGGLYLWDLTSGAPIGGPVEGHDGAVTQVEFSPDGTRLLSVGEDGSVLQWATAAGLHDPRGRDDGAGPAQTAAYAADGAVIATIGCGDERCGTAEAELRLWHGETLEPIGAATRGHSPLPREDPARPRRVGFAARGTALVSASADGVRLTDISIDGMRSRACALAGRDLEAAEWRRRETFGEDKPEICPTVPRPDELSAQDPSGRSAGRPNRARRRR